MAEMKPDDKLAALFAEQAPPTRDPQFCAEVMERVVRRRAWARVGAAVPWAVSAGAVVWALQPVLGPHVEVLAEALVLPGAVLGAAAVTALTGLMAARRLAR